ncbi:restriction endonuclease subunit S [Acetobacter indonesiensis]
MLPDGWKIFRGEEIAQKITKGQSPKWQGFEYQKDGAIFITSENVRDGFLDISKPKFLPIEFSNKIKGSQLKKGDVLINLVGASIGRSCLYEKNLPHANINQAVCTFRTNSHADPHFLALFFQHPKTIDRLICGQNASARQNISLGDIKNFEILLPPLPEQKKIAAILSTWDRAIEGTEKLLANSQQQKKALMQQLLTGKKRLPGFTEEWVTKKLKDISKIYDGTHQTPDYVEIGIPFYSVEHLTSGKFNNTKFVSEEIYLNESKKRKIEKNDILLTRIGDIGTARIIDWNVRASFYVSLALIKSSKVMSPKFFECALNGELFRRELWHRTIHVAFPKKINLGDIGDCSIYFPPLPEQKAIAAVLTTADEEITAIESDLSRLRQEKKALMQQLLTGKRRVTVD